MAIIDSRDTVEIPGPRGYFLVGNITDFDPEQPTLSLMNLSREYGVLHLVSYDLYPRALT